MDWLAPCLYNYLSPSYSIKKTYIQPDLIIGIVSPISKFYFIISKIPQIPQIRGDDLLKSR